MLFCDLVDSTRLSRQLDPEDYREVVRAYQAAAAEAVQRFDGYIAQYLGDGLLVYFGYPQAHEDDAQRAGRAGLEMVQGIASLRTRLTRDRGLRLAGRVGIHTGAAVVGTMGGGNRQEQLALGDTPNLAARLQGLAAPNTVVVSATTHGLIEGFFTCQALGEHALKGVEEPMLVYQLLAESGAQTRLDTVAPHGLTPLVGREQELGLLLARWAQSAEGRGQVVLLSGEAGIGKSRLVEVLHERLGRGAGHVADVSLFPLPYQQCPLSRDCLSPTRPAISARRVRRWSGVPKSTNRRPRKPWSPGWSQRQSASRCWQYGKTCTGPIPRPWSCWA